MSWLRFAIVGSGPAGFFSAKNLLKHFPEASVDMYERLPSPFGLIRYGVAPDHPEIKRVLNDFARLAQTSNFRFLGNVTIGRDLSHRDLARCYSAIIYAYGAASDSSLGIPGEEFIVSARKFVEWYNGHPEAVPFQLANVKSVCIIGNGNVAVDVVRILGAPQSQLEHTDIASSALEELRRSAVRDIHVVGRRGMLQAACTAKELRQLSSVEGMSHRIFAADLEASLNESSRKECDFDQPSGTTIHTRAKRRLFEIFNSFRRDADPSARVRVHWHFLKSPVRTDGASMTLQHNELEGPPSNQSSRPIPSQLSSLSADLFFKSLGYKSLQIDSDIPFNAAQGIVENIGCRVQAPGPARTYVTGWARTGPFGVLDTTMRSVFVRLTQVMMDSLLEDYRQQLLQPPEAETDSVLCSLKRVVSFEGWRKIDAYELSQGAAKGKTREKVVDIEEMLDLAEG
jgi:adrenodoxin-NADP+ reductase